MAIDQDEALSGVLIQLYVHLTVGTPLNKEVLASLGENGKSLVHIGNATLDAPSPHMVPLLDGDDPKLIVGSLRLVVPGTTATTADQPQTPNSHHSTYSCLLYTSDAADEEDSVDLGGRRIIKQKKTSNRG
eukprot:TRINITY_DN51112_c0_g1_i1.p2 TRINITY_DN51112_c0_g1~~TRINITY_DN51112_c0_g1_i1.p2  ORF type:complete len:131 (-),score=21.26 TRINITY_DN51112_c0_g1_i1:79-471(-)